MSLVVVGANVIPAFSWVIPVGGWASWDSGSSAGDSQVRKVANVLHQRVEPFAVSHEWAPPKGMEQQHGHHQPGGPARRKYDLRESAWYQAAVL